MAAHNPWRLVPENGHVAEGAIWPLILAGTVRYVLILVVVP